MEKERRRPTTAYAILGLLALQPWSTYELAQQVKRSLNWIWPRTERRLYDEPKRLVADGLATSTLSYNGQRRRTVYEITEAGRTELADWLGRPPVPRTVEFEGLLKVFFADAGSRASLLSTLDEIAGDARERMVRLDAMIEQILHDGARFPERTHLQVLGLRQHVDVEAAVMGWAAWARTQVQSWQGTTDPGTWPAEDELTRLHQRITTLLQE
ncbi:PadR family transcriptional regulator [Nocardioides sp.]|uniref:PadR family transcriptional regulator n=1 Tax=Nocardioides sp. TaxID=35761 RepID=UPI002735BD7C|nr:helix-turn-helix transcriptional regulator [Nocardioides sp.]MDP3894719.1 helix-turn-helix transcriptional regulator [Nocardioides sp.]